MGNLASDANKIDSANYYLQKSYKFALKINEVDMFCYLTSSLADLKIKQKKHIEAQKYIDTAYKYAKKMNYPEAEPSRYQNNVS